MKLEILHVPDCPNVAVLEHRLREATTGEAVTLSITHRVIDNPDQAAAAGMTGSPTLLVDGRDPGEGRREIVDHQLVDGIAQSCLCLEVMLDQTEGDTGLGGDRAQRHPVLAEAREQVERGIADPRPGGQVVVRCPGIHHT